MSHTYSAAGFNMPYSVVVEKVAGDGPRLFRYSATTSIWIGKDDDVESIQPPVQEYNDIVITFSGDVRSVYLDFMAINRNSDGEEQIQSIYPQTASGSNITTGVSYLYEPGVPTGNAGATYFSNTTKTIYVRPGNVDNGRIHITSATPFRKVRFRWKEISDLSYSGPNGIVLRHIQYCPVLPEITCLYQSLIQEVSDTVIGPSISPYQDSILNFTITNVGTATLNLSNIQLSGNPYYQLLSATSLSLAPAASSIISVRYRPLAIGSHVTNLLFQTNDFTEPNYNISIQSQCSGPAITVENNGFFLSNPSSVSTRPTLLGQTDTLTFYIRNQGNASLQVNSIQSTQSTQWTRLSNAPLLLASGQSDSFKVLYHPTVAGTSTLPLLILSNDYLNDSFRIVIQGISTQPIQISQSVCNQSLPFNWNGMSINQTGTYIYMSSSSQGFDSLTQLNLTVNYADTVRFSQQICAQDLPYQWQQGQLTQGGTYQTVLSNRFGCDSLIILQLNVINPPSTVLFDSICQNNTPYSWQNNDIYVPGQYVDTLISAQGCDSIVYLNLYVFPTPVDTTYSTICSNLLPYVWNEIPITQSGTYQYVQPVASGCDSISVLRLQVLQTDSTQLFRQECSNSLPLTWAGLQFTQAGIQSRILTNRVGCDSLVYYNLQILPTAQTQVSQTVCQNNLPISWNGIVFNQGGQNDVLLQTVSGCDSLVQMTLNVLPTYRDTLRFTICQHDLPFVWSNQSYTQSGFYTQNGQTTAGCDSISNLILTVNSDTVVTRSQRICQTQLPYSWNGQVFTTADTISILYNNVLGCDSTVILQLQVDPVYNIQEQRTVCQNQLPMIWNGVTFNQAGQNSAILQASNGCDSAVQMTLNVLPTYRDTLRFSVCQHDLPFVWSNQSYTQSGFYTQNGQTTAGCDSISNLILTVNSDTVVTRSKRICQNQLPYSWNGLVFTAADTISILYNNVLGCDSTVILQLQVDSVYFKRTQRTICQNDLPIIWNGVTFNQSGNSTVTLQTINGCDSVVQMTLNVRFTLSDTVRHEICSHDLPFVWGNQSYTQSGFYTRFGQTASGCDSISNLILTVNADTVVTRSQRICQSQLPFTWNGQVFNSADTISILYNSVLGCDSTVIMQLQVDPVFAQQIQRTVCQNELPLSWNGITFNQAGQNSVVFQTSNGCDSLVQMTLNVLPAYRDTVRFSVCRHDLPFVWGNQSYNQSGFYTQNGQTVSGCDSISNLILTVNLDTVVTLSQRICQNQLPLTWYGQVFNSSDTVTTLYNSAFGCDSTVILQVQVDSVYRRQLQRTICLSELPLSWDGLVFYDAGSQQQLYNSVNSCDSLVTYQLTVLPISQSQQYLSINVNATPYLWNGISISQSGSYTAILTGANGCDSIIYLAVRVIQLPPIIEVSYDSIIIQQMQTLGLPNLVVNQIYDFNFKVKNIGQNPLIISQITENQNYAQISSGIQNAINQLQFDSFNLRLSPLQLGPQTLIVEVSSNDPNVPIFQFSLSFRVINGPAPEIALSYQQSQIANQATISLVNQPVFVGQTQLIQLAVQNIGTANLQLHQLISDNPNVQIDTNHLSLLAPYAQTFIMLRYTPVLAGSEQMKLTILNNDADESTTEINFNLQAILQNFPEIEVNIDNQLRLNQSAHFMGTTGQGSTLQQPVRIINVGTSPLQISQVSFLSGSQTFSFQGATTNLIVNPGSFVNLNLNFSAQAVGTYTTTISIASNDADENPYRISVSAQVLPLTLPNCTQCNALNVLTNPLNYAEWIDDKPRLTWQHEEGLNIQYYRLEMWVSSGNTWTPVIVNGNLNNQVFPTNSELIVFQVTNGLSYFKEHRWKVTAYNNQNLPIVCFTREFLVQKRPEVQPWSCPQPNPNVPNFGSELGQFNNVPIYKNGGCEDGVYNSNSNSIWTQFYNNNFLRNQYGWQCAELPPRYYTTRFKISVGRGDGVAYSNVNANHRIGFRKFVNGQSTVPPTTDDIISRTAFRHPHGHVVIAKGGPIDSNAISSIRVIQQNAGSNVPMHINGSLPIKKQNNKYTITDRSQGIWSSWIRAKPELIVPGDDKSIPIVNSTTPDFRWALHPQIKGYQFKLYKLFGTCYRLQHDILITGNSALQIPALDAGETYKWTIENIFQVPGQTTNWNKKVLSMANYFRVSNQATANRLMSPLSSMGQEDQFIWVQTVGSPLSGAEIWFKNDEDWFFSASTEQLSSNFISSNYILPEDSLWVVRKGYDDLKFVVNEHLNARGKYYVPLFPKISNPIKVEVSLQNQSLFVPANDIQLKIKGENFTQYQLYYDDVLHPEIYNYSDSILAIPYLVSGYQSVRVYAMNADDTLSVDHHFIITDGNEEQMNVSFAMRKEQKVQIYLDHQFFAEIKSSQQFTIPRSHYVLTLKGSGLETQELEIESDTIIQVELSETPWIMNNQTFDIEANKSVYFDVYATVTSEERTRVELVSDSSFTQDSIYMALSETLHFTKKMNSTQNMQIKWIVDKQLIDEDLYLRWEENGNVQYLPLFGSSAIFLFEAQTQLLHIFNIAEDFNCTIVKKKQSGIFDDTDNTLHLFPNPNSGDFTLFIPQIEGQAQIDIYDLLGRLVYSEKSREWVNHAIEVKNLDLASGNYFVRLSSGNQSYLSKLSIKN
jgi:hypothetical protein